MVKYITKRLLILIPVLLGVSFLVFSILAMMPADVASVQLGVSATPEGIEKWNEEHGLNDPFLERYFDYMKGLLTGDPGVSWSSNTSIKTEFLQRIPSTMALTAGTIVLVILLGVPVGIISAIKQYSIFDNVTRLLAMLLTSLPAFWLGLLLILKVSLDLDWLPATCHVNITYPSYGTCPGLDEYYDKITGNPKYALHGMCNPLMIWQQRKAETDGLDAYKARNIYYHSIFDDLVKINNRIIVDEPTLRRGLNGCCVPGKKRLYVTATGEYKACERIGSSPSIGNVDEGVDRELIVKKYVEEFAAQSKDICDKCWAYNL